MAANILASLLMVAMVLPIAGLAGGLATPDRRRLLLAALAVFVVDGVLLALPGTVGLSVGNYNWAGKLLSIVVLWTAVLRLPVLAPARACLGRPAADWVRPTILCTALLAGGTAAINLHFGNSSTLSLETLAYQASLPGLSEELVFRAAVLAGVAAATAPAQARAAVPGRQILSAGALVSSLLFALAHGFYLDTDLSPQVEPWNLAYTGAIGLGLAWLTLRTQSIWPAIIAHNVVNLVGEAVRLANG